MKYTATQQILDSLKEPQQEYRTIPFWSWNEKLSPEELTRQIKEMKKSGVGGYFMHARGGLETEYLQKPWFDCIELGINAGKEEGLRAWVYDEEGWPSGFAGGYVTQKGDWVYARGLRMRYINHASEATTDSSLLGVFTIDEGENSIVEITHYCSPFYVDVLNKDVIAEFIKETHEKYAAKFEIGEGLAGFFTDEPRISVGSVPWSYILPEEFKARYGYDIMPHLPSLFLPWGEYAAIRHDFWQLINDLFVNAYMKQQGDWCEAHNCKLTGHMMMEESLYSQMTGTGGGMPFYEFMHQPGVDSLRRNVNDPRIPKQVGSVAEQLGKKQVISESYALCGWDLNFDEMRWIAGWQFVNGVNLICQHLQAYSLKGERKRDYPPSLFHQQTWYDEYYRFNDFIARLGQLLGSGKKAIDVLLIHPMHSGWIAYDGTNNDIIKQLDSDFSKATLMLSAAHIDYHLGDETIMRRHARLVDKGAVSIGEYSYNTIVVPSCITLDKDTVNTITHAVNGGCKLICLGTKPTMCSGRESKEVKELFEKAVCVDAVKQLKETINTINKPISISKNGIECEDIHCCQMSTNTDATAVFAINMNRTQGHIVQLQLKGVCQISELSLDALTAEVLATRYENGNTIVELEFRPMQAMVLTYEYSQAVTKAAEKYDKITLKNNTWKLASIDDNVFTLDMCQYSVNGGQWQEKTAVIHLMDKLLHMRKECKLKQKFSFNILCDKDKLSCMQLVIEQPDKFTVSVNGKTVQLPMLTKQLDENVNYKDIAFYKVDIFSLVQKGENIIELECDFKQRAKVYEVLYGENVYETERNKLTYDIELESIYLIGDFGVYCDKPFEKEERNAITTNGNFCIDVLPKQLNKGDFTQQGLTFFAGTLKVETNINITDKNKPVRLCLGEVRSALTKLYVNDNLVKTFLWGEFISDITSYIKDGDNKITLHLYASNRNMLGPHHHTKGESYSVGPNSFAGEFSWVEHTGEAAPIPKELRNQNFWRDEYSFVTFGV